MHLRILSSVLLIEMYDLRGKELNYRKELLLNHYRKSFIKLYEVAGHVCSGIRRKFSWGVHPVAYGGNLYLLCALRDVTIRRHIHVSKQTFW